MADNCKDIPWNLTIDETALYPIVIKDKSIYKVTDVKKKEDGTTEQKLSEVSNFIARIDETVTSDNGQDQSTEYRISIQSETRAKPFQIQIPAEEFSYIRWAQEKGGPDLRTSPSVKNANSYVRDTIQRLSGIPKTRVIYTHTGWRDGKYLMPGTDGYDVQLPDGNFMNYKLPPFAANPIEAMHKSIHLGLCGGDFAPLRITAPMWGCIFRAPLIEATPLTSSEMIISVF